MASKAFLMAAAAARESKNVETVLIGSGFMPEGTHDVTIKSVDTSTLDDGKVSVTYSNTEGKEYREMVFLTSRDGDFSYGLRALWSALIPDTTAIESLMEWIGRSDRALETFTGMKLRITLEPGFGIQARTTGNGKFAGFDVQSGEKSTEEFDEIKEVYDDVKARELKRSYLRVRNSKVTAKEDNIAAFFKAVTAIDSGTRSGVTGMAFSTSRSV